MESFLSNDCDDAEKTENFESMIVDAEIEPSLEPEQMETEEVEEIDNEETESNEDSPTESKSKVLQKKSKPKNGKRKRSSSCDSLLNEFEESAKIRKPLTDTNKSINVGEEFQACIPDDIDPNSISNSEDPDELLWDTPENIDEAGLQEFVKESSERYRIPIDRALWILTREKFSFESAIKQIAKRKEHRDLWTDEEARTFHNAYSLVGKHFACIRQMLPHRSHQSIVQYYYDNKKRITYNNFVEMHMNEGYSSDEEIEKPVYPDTLFEGMCENCGEQAEQLQMNDAMNRTECKACLNYFKRMNVPRPTSLRLVLSERVSNSVACPEHMKPYMDEYEKLTQLATGSTYVYRKMGKYQTLDDIIGVNEKVKEEEPESFCEENDESLNSSNGVHVGEESVKPAPIKIEENECPKKERVEANETSAPPQTVTEEPVDIQEEKPIALEEPELPPPSTSESPEPVNKATPEIWQAQHTRCMEEIEVLADDSRRKLFEACLSASRVNLKEISKWRAEMVELHHRMERMSVDVDLIPSLLMSNERAHYEQEWSEFEKQEAVRLFNWYGKSFNYIADVLGNKTREQVKEFYDQNKEIIDKKKCVLKKRAPSEMDIKII